MIRGNQLLATGSKLGTPSEMSREAGVQPVRQIPSSIAAPPGRMEPCPSSSHVRAATDVQTHGVGTGGLSYFADAVWVLDELRLNAESPVMMLSPARQTEGK